MAFTVNKRRSLSWNLPKHIKKNFAPIWLYLQEYPAYILRRFPKELTSHLCDFKKITVIQSKRTVRNSSIFGNFVSLNVHVLHVSY